MTTLARHLQRRGHDVRFMGFLDSEAAIRTAGLQFVPICERAFPRGELAGRLHRLSVLKGQEALQFTVDLLADMCHAVLEDGARALHDTATEALVLDTVHRGLNLVAMHMGLPYVHVASALHFDFSGHTPLSVFDWPHATGPEAMARNLEGTRMGRAMSSRIIEVQREYSERMGLPLDWSEPAAGISQLAWLTQCPREFDFKSDHWPPYFHHIGPLQDGEGRAPVPFPWARLTGEPVIYASMGTLQTGLDDVFRMIAGAAGAPGRQLVLAVGDHLDAERIGPVPANTIVVQQAPQLELLPRAALCITHAGLNTALESLANGVPMVAIPITNDQPGVAARIAHSGTGVFIPLPELTTERLRAAVDRVLTEPSFRENARRLQKAIARKNGPEVGADLIEKAFRVKHRRGTARAQGG